MKRFILALSLLLCSLSVSAMSADKIRRDTDFVKKATVLTYMGTSVLKGLGIIAGGCTAPTTALIVGGACVAKIGYDYLSNTKETK